MFKAAAAVALLVSILTMMPDTALIRFNVEAARLHPNRSLAGEQTARNKFARRWHSRITLSSGEEIDEGVIDISDANPPSEDKVIVSHPRYGGSHTAYTMSYPDRIEIQIPLGDGRVAHYNGVLVSRNRIEGQFFIVAGEQSRQSRSANKRVHVVYKTPAVAVESGTWEGGVG